MLDEIQLDGSDPQLSQLRQGTTETEGLLTQLIFLHINHGEALREREIEFLNQGPMDPHQIQRGVK